MKIAALAGGVGGAKLADGLARSLPSEDLTIIVNTGDDFIHWGLNICPDIDTVCYTLAGLSNTETGWGRAGETWQVLEQVTALGGESWFRIGDRDLATHLERTRRLHAGEPLSSIIASFCSAWGIAPAVLPATDASVPTMVNTLEYGELTFQEYFVHRQCQPTVSGFRFAGIENARPLPQAIHAIQAADAVIFCPSNPWVSIDPILRLPGMTPALTGKPVIAVSPIIGGKTIKGPAAKMFAELGISPSALAVASHYQGMVTHFVADSQDSALLESIRALGMQAQSMNTIMQSPEDRQQLAQNMLHLIGRA